MRPHKALYPFENKPWIVHQIEKIVSIGFESVSVVLGFEKEEIKPVISGLKVNIFENPNPELGQFSSLLCVLKHCRQDAFVLTLDTPCPDKLVWEKICSEQSAHLVVRPRFQGRGGHPVLIAHDFVRTLKALKSEDSESRLDLQIKKLKSEEVLNVDVLDHKILLNLNTLKDFESLALANANSPKIF